MTVRCCSLAGCMPCAWLLLQDCCDASEAAGCSWCVKACCRACLTGAEQQLFEAEVMVPPGRLWVLASLGRSETSNDDACFWAVLQPSWVGVIAHMDEVPESAV